MKIKYYKFPFPFFGAGFTEKRYFGIYSYLRFVNPPDQEQQGKIAEISPDFFHTDSEYFYGRIFEIKSREREDLNEFFEARFGDKNLINDDFYELSPAAQEGPVIELENWILAIHKICRVEFVIRFDAWREAINNQDMYEVENIYHRRGALVIKPASKWHYESIQRIPELLKTWAEEKTPEDLKCKEEIRFGSIVQWILSMGGQKATEIPEIIIDRYLALTKMQHLFMKDFAAGVEYFRKQKDAVLLHPEFELRSMIVAFGKYNPGHVLSLADIFLNSENKQFLSATLPYFIYAAIVENKTERIPEFIQKISNNSNTAACLLAIDSFIRSRLHEEKEFATGIRMYEYLFAIPAPENAIHLSIYCNALWILQNDNTGLPVDAEKNKSFLKICLPHAAENPAIYLNAACLYNEMQDYENAINCIEKAAAHSCKELPTLIKQIETAPVFETLRGNERIQKLIAEMQK